jgi:DNA-directed RNA polymerase specialized sigma subunit
MTAKEYLRQAYKMDKRIRILQGKVDKLRSALEYHSPSLEGGGGSGSADRMPDTISKIMEYEQHAAQLQTAYVDKYIEIDRAIHSVEDDTMREVLERRYLLYQKWEQIAQEMHFTERRIFQLHGKALQKISLNFSI